MRHGSLLERLERSRPPSAREPQSGIPPATPDKASPELVVLRDVASALQIAARTVNDAPLASTPGREVPAGDSFPLMLAGRSAAAPPCAPAETTQRRDFRQLAAPLLLTAAVIGVVILMSAGSIEQPRPRLARAPAIEAANFIQPAEAGKPDGAALAPNLIAEAALLERCETLIARGDIRTARDELAAAAAAGGLSARFALAETFDPNVLAAWGLRENVADAAVARVLYGQALDAGDVRALSRLAALGDSRDGAR